jgi:hypothetical protein
VLPIVTELVGALNARVCVEVEKVNVDSPSQFPAVDDAY